MAQDFSEIWYTITVNRQSVLIIILKLCSVVYPSKCTMFAAQHDINSYSNERYDIAAVPTCKFLGVLVCSSKSLLAGVSLEN